MELLWRVERNFYERRGLGFVFIIRFHYVPRSEYNYF